ncbi:hypothetical protein GJ496_004973 [Pomphorhynchus laevis]|nr:hypothetical protein GJ496_004973 [Pomphorhynchus laevis]
MDNEDIRSEILIVSRSEILLVSRSEILIVSRSEILLVSRSEILLVSRFTISTEPFIDQQKENISEAFKEVIYWKPHLFHLKQCNSSHDFVNRLASCYHQIGNALQGGNIALETAPVLCQCILQGFCSKKVSLTRKAIERRLKLWDEENIINEVINEGRVLQSRKFSIRDSIVNNQNWHLRFRKLMKNDKTTAAMRLLEMNGKDYGILDLQSLVKGKTERYSKLVTS